MESHWLANRRADGWESMASPHVTGLNQQARTHLAASGRLHGPTLKAGDQTFQAGDRILCRQNQAVIGVLIGDLATVVSADPDHGTLTLQLGRDTETKKALPAWYLEQDVDYG